MQPHVHIVLTRTVIKIHSDTQKNHKTNAFYVMLCYAMLCTLAENFILIKRFYALVFVTSFMKFRHCVCVTETERYSYSYQSRQLK